jgi:hypothetical protein
MFGWFRRRPKVDHDASALAARLANENEQLRTRLEAFGAPDVVASMMQGIAGVFKAMSEAEVARLQATATDRTEERKLAQEAREARREAAKNARNHYKPKQAYGGCRVCANDHDPAITLDDLSFHYGNHRADAAPLKNGKGA